MNTAPHPLEEDLSITGKNRHQYLETAVASASDAERLIRRAQSRGHARELREEELRQKIRLAAGVFAMAVAVTGIAALWFVLSR
ncbi:MAG: hypothetical protein EOO54_15910 [Haliea sp.]|nr:MAG: hypothetical protein EOO54_15910 [Haliea sp.]